MSVKETVEHWAFNPNDVKQVRWSPPSVDRTKDINELTNRVEKLEADNTYGEVKKLRRELNNLDQYARRENLEVHGVPAVAGENMLTPLNTLAEELHLAPFYENAFDAVH